MTESTNVYSVKVPVFEGPLDLLLHLLRQDKIDIYDIPISHITRQYLDYVEMMKEFNLEIASEFLVMAATLIYIKSRMLLPPDETIETAEQEDPRAGLVQRLLEYQAIKEASTSLKEREALWTNILSKEPMTEEALMAGEETELLLFEVNLFDLLGALQKIIKKAPPEAIKITKATLTVKDKIALILEKMEAEHTLRFDALFEEDRTKVEIIVTFLALLELLRLKLMRAYQDKEFGAIWIMRQQDDDAQQEAVPQPEAYAQGEQTIDDHQEHVQDHGASATDDYTEQQNLQDDSMSHDVPSDDDEVQENAGSAAPELSTIQETAPEIREQDTYETETYEAHVAVQEEHAEESCVQDVQEQDAVLSDITSEDSGRQESYDSESDSVVPENSDMQETEPDVHETEAYEADTNEANASAQAEYTEDNLAHIIEEHESEAPEPISANSSLEDSESQECPESNNGNGDVAPESSNGDVL